MASFLKKNVASTREIWGYDFVLKYVVNFLFAKILIKLSGDTLNNLSNNLGSFRRILQGMGIYRTRTFITY